MTNQLSDIAVIGLGVMGHNLARNFAQKGFRTLGYDRDSKKAEALVQSHGSDHLKVSQSVEELVQQLKMPRKILFMVPAGELVDEVIRELSPLLNKGDVLMDGGNSHYKDTIRRTQELEKQGLHFVGMGISGGEEGALHGPSLMPGGSAEAWEIMASVLEKMAAKDFSGKPCVTHVGSGGAGHYVKMLHNGIEYAVMQMMAEAYDLLKSCYELSPPQIADIFGRYQKGKLKSFLFEIAIPVLRQRDDLAESGYLIDRILDAAGQKGTGSWSAIDALERGGILSGVTAAVQARSLSARKTERLELHDAFDSTVKQPNIELKNFIPLLEDALYAGMICAYAEGLDLIAIAAKEQKWNVDLAEITRIWQGGCIIRADLLKQLHEALLKSQDESEHLFALPSMQALLKNHIPALRFATSVGLAAGLPLPAMSASLNYFTSMTRDVLPANFIQGLRDYFGAHTYQRVDREGVFHTNWGDL